MINKKGLVKKLVSIMIVVWMLPLAVTAHHENVNFNARDLAREMVTLVVPFIQGRDIVIQNSIREQSKLSTEQKEKFGELLTNILMNAVTSSPKNSQIQISYNESRHILEITVSNPDTRFDTQQTIKDLRGNNISIESKQGQGVWYRVTI